MKDYLWAFCSQLNIEVLYTADDSVILSCGFQDNIPTIQIHKVFTNCPQSVANAVIDFCLQYDNLERDVEVIRSYASHLLLSKKHHINPPDEKFISFIKKYILPVEKTHAPAIKPKKSSNLNDGSEMHELNISSMTQKNFHGGKVTISPNEGFHASDDDVVELDIVVDNYTT